MWYGVWSDETDEVKLMRSVRVKSRTIESRRLRSVFGWYLYDHTNLVQIMRRLVWMISYCCLPRCYYPMQCSNGVWTAVSTELLEKDEHMCMPMIYLVNAGYCGRCGHGTTKCSLAAAFLSVLLFNVDVLTLIVRDSNL